MMVTQDSLMLKYVLLFSGFFFMLIFMTPDNIISTDQITLSFVSLEKQIAMESWIEEMWLNPNSVTPWLYVT